MADNAAILGFPARGEVAERLKAAVMMKDRFFLIRIHAECNLFVWLCGLEIASGVRASFVLRIALIVRRIKDATVSSLSRARRIRNRWSSSVMLK